MLERLSQQLEDFRQWILHMADQINKPKKVRHKFAHHGKFISQFSISSKMLQEISNFLTTNLLFMETLQLHRSLNTGEVMIIESILVWMHLK